ncbi:hypothetical protein KJ616_01495 [Patescibacteria group bacterium]|nr:hypothetical protein [Patescibacteria group bacterium]
MNKVIAIPRDLSKTGDLVVMPRDEYEEFLRLKKIISLVESTLSEKKAIKAGRKEIREGKYLTLSQLKNEMEG